eukprot:226993_1
MFNVFLSLFLLISNVKSDCGHVFYYPLDVCISDGDYYSWIITCSTETDGTSTTATATATTSTEEYTVTWYNSSDCDTDSYEWDSISFDGDSEYCGGDNACSCSSEECEVFTWTAGTTCSYGGEDWSYVYSQSVVLDECVSFYDDYSSSGDAYYYMFECSDDDDSDDSDDIQIPIKLGLYADSDCTEEEFSTDDYFDVGSEDDDDDDSDTDTSNYYWGGGGYDTDDSNYGSGYTCEYAQDVNCEYQIGSGDLADCSYFNHYPIGACSGNYYNDFDFCDDYYYYTADSSNKRRRLYDYYDDTTSTTTYYSYGCYGWWDSTDTTSTTSTAVGGDRRRLSSYYNSYSKYVCSTDSDG